MKKIIYLLFFVSTITFADTIQVGNSTGDVIRVRVGFTTSGGCTPTSWVTTCIAPYDTQVLTSPGIPFVVRAYTGCADFDPASLSWTFNPWAGCAATIDTPVYNIIWSGAIDVTDSWGATVTI